MLNSVKKTLFIGKVFHYLDIIDSTNTFAIDLTKTGPPEGTVIWADYQSAGKGQGTNNWHSSAGKNITMSVILLPAFLSAQQHFLFNQCISLGIHDFLQKYFKNSSIKWPNDLYIGNKKIGGILIQNSLQGKLFKNAVVGIGLNVNETDFPEEVPNATSFKLEGMEEKPLPILVEELCLSLEQRYLQLRSKQFELIRRDYLHHAYQLNQWANYRDPLGTIFKGKITGFSIDGKLIMELENKAQADFLPKEVVFL